MYSAPYLYFLARTIPALIKKYLRVCFEISDEMCDFYLSIMLCPSCTVCITGYWQSQLSFLMSRVIDNLFRSEVPEEMLTVATMVPLEYRMEEWVSVVRGDFRTMSGNECKVVNKLLEFRIIEVKNLPAFKRSYRQVIEPITGTTLQPSEHASEVLANISDYYSWTRDFRVSVEGRIEQ